MYDELVLFVKIVKSGSFTQASKDSGVSLSNLTRKIQKLEQTLNLILLKRDTRALELSGSGRQLYDKFCNLELELKNTITNIAKCNGELSGTINVLLPPFFALKTITPYLMIFLLKHPKISLNITYQNKVTNMVKENYDLAIVSQRPLKSSQKMKLLCRSKIIFYCYPEYLQKHTLPLTQEHIEEKLILSTMLEHGIEDKITYIINNKTGQRKPFHHSYHIMQHSWMHDQELTKSGLTIGVGLDLMLKNDIQAGNIIHLLSEYYIPGFDYYLLINPEGKNARTETFINFITECMHHLDLDDNLSIR